MFCLLTALEEEQKPFLECLEDPQEEKSGPYTWRTGTLAGKRVALGLAGVGKVMAAAASQAAIDRFRPEGLIFSGIAGALNPHLSRGDLVVARDCVQYDLDLSRYGCAPGEIPRSGLRFFPSGPVFLAAAESFSPRGYVLYLGRVLTGDLFLTPELLPRYAGSIANLAGDAVDMEGAAAALPAFTHGVPFLLVRSISDQVSDGPAAGFSRAARTGAERCLALIRWILSRT